MLLVVTFVVSAIMMEFLHLCRVNIFKFTVLMGTFGLAMAFAGNDLVNFIGVPLAGLSSYNDYMANANGAAPDSFMMTSLMCNGCAECYRWMAYHGRCGFRRLWCRLPRHALRWHRHPECLYHPRHRDAHPQQHQVQPKGEGREQGQHLPTDDALSRPRDSLGLRRMLDPIKEHVDNNFNPLPADYIKEFSPVRQKINDLMKMSCEQIETSRYESYREILAEADACKDELSVIRKKHIDRIQNLSDNSLMQISLVYLNVLQESQEFLSVMRHQLRAAKKFMEN